MTYFPNDLESCGFFGGPKLVHKDPNPLGPLGADTLGFSKDMESPGRTLLLGQEKSAQQTGFPFRNMQRSRSRHILQDLQVSLDPLHLELLSIWSNGQASLSTVYPVSTL